LARRQPESGRRLAVLRVQVRSLYDTLLSTMKDGRRLGQSGRYARLAPRLRRASPIKFIHIAQILNGAIE
jgi:hypothetical protein